MRHFPFILIILGLASSALLGCASPKKLWRGCKKIPNANSFYTDREKP